MELISLFCDRASIDGGGRLDLGGVFTELQAPGFPARRERITLVVIVHWERERSGRVPFRIDLLDPEARSVFTAEGHTDVIPRPADAAPAKTQLVLPLEKVVFPAAGAYRLRIELGGQQCERAGLFVARAIEPESNGDL